MVLLVVLTLNFARHRMAPGDPADYLLGEAVEDLTPEERSQALAGQFCDRLVVLQQGRVVEEGPTERVIEFPERAYTRALIGAVIEPPIDQHGGGMFLAGGEAAVHIDRASTGGENLYPGLLRPARI